MNRQITYLQCSDWNRTYRKGKWVLLRVQTIFSEYNQHICKIFNFHMIAYYCSDTLQRKFEFCLASLTQEIFLPD